MRKQDVPQDRAVLGRWHEICYALDEEGRYALAPSAGWEPANVANLQAWEVIAEEIARAVEAVRCGETSPPAFHMARCQMDVGLLASYAHLARWRVKRHLRPGGYARLTPGCVSAMPGPSGFPSKNSTAFPKSRNFPWFWKMTTRINAREHRFFSPSVGPL